MMCRRISCLVVVISCVVGATAQAEVTPEKGKHYTIYILAGQSNMDGRAKANDLTGQLAGFAVPKRNVLVRYASGGYKRKLRASDGLVPLQPGCNENAAQFGPELAFGHAMAEARPKETILLIKVSEGGTSLHTDWNPDNPKSLYHRLMAVDKETCDQLTQHGATYEIGGMAWHQGESDAGKAEDYAKLLTAFIARIRTDLKRPDMPFVIGEVCGANPQYQGILAAQRAVAASVPSVGVASSEGLTTHDKNVHFDCASQLELGRRFGEAMLTLKAKPAPATTRRK